MEGARRVPGWTPVDFFILRHGQTTWNARGIIQGQADAPLLVHLMLVLPDETVHAVPSGGTEWGEVGYAGIIIRLDGAERQG